jgi:hypothetical protein
MSKTNTTPVAAVPAVKPNARAHLRNLFAKVGAVATEKEVMAEFKPITIKTHLTDFKNPKYAGKAGTINIVKMTDGTYKRLPDTKPAEQKAA